MYSSTGSPMGRWCSTLALLLVCCAAGAGAAPANTLPADKLNVTDTATAFQGAALYPQLSIIMNVIKGDAVMRQYLTTPNQTLTAFPTSDKSNKAFLQKLGRYAGLALQNDTFIQSIFRFMIVPGKAWTAAELYEAAPISLKTLGGEPLNITRDPTGEALYGILVNGGPINIGNQATKDKKVVLHIVDGGMVPPSQLPIFNQWAGGETKGAEAAGPADQAAPAATAPPPRTSGAARRNGAGAAVAPMGAAAAVLALLL